MTPKPSRNLLIHKPFMVLTALSLLVGQWVFLRRFPFDYGRDKFILAFAVFSQTLLFCSALIFLLGGLGKLSKRFTKTTSLLWAVVLLSTTFYFIERVVRESFDVTFAEGVHVFKECFLNVSFWSLPREVRIMAFALVPVLVLVVALTAWVHRKLARLEKNQVGIRPLWAGALMGVAVICTLTSQYIGSRWLSPRAWEGQLEIPGHFASFFDERGKMAIVVEGPTFKKLPPREVVEERIKNTLPLASGKKPNIFLIVIDSLRKDVINQSVSPNMHALKQISLPVENFISEGNCTHVSWYSLFTAKYPHFWHLLWKDPAPDIGSVPLRMMKALGYNLYVMEHDVFPAHGLREKVFGKGNTLVREFTSEGYRREMLWEEESVANIDQLLTDRTLELAQTPGNEEGNLFLLTLNSAHWPYRWTAKWTPTHVPYYQKKPTFEDMFNIDYPLLFNRYMNSTSFVDFQVGRVLDFLKKTNRFENSIVVVLGDHGEEFGEMGKGIHCGSPNRFVLNPPLMFHVPKTLLGKSPVSPVRLSSLADIFPTVVDVLGRPETLEGLVDGTSLLNPVDREFVLSVGGSNVYPREILLSDGAQSARFKLDGSWETDLTFHARNIKLIEFRDDKDLPVDLPPQEKEERNRYFMKGLAKILEAKSIPKLSSNER